MRQSSTLLKALAFSSLTIVLVACSSAPMEREGEDTGTTAAALEIRGGAHPTIPRGIPTTVPTPTWNPSCNPGDAVTKPYSFYVRTQSKTCATRVGTGGTWAGVDIFQVPGSGECRYTWQPTAGTRAEPDFVTLESDAAAIYYATSADRLITPDCMTTEYIPFELIPALRKHAEDMNSLHAWLFPRVGLVSIPIVQGCGTCRAQVVDGNVLVILPFGDSTPHDLFVSLDPNTQILTTSTPYVPFASMGNQFTSVPIPAGVPALANGTELPVFHTLNAQ